jgi:hypothetical protein
MQLAIVVGLLLLAAADALDLPTQTAMGGIAVAQATPATTAAPQYVAELLRRQDSDATSLCGYVAGNGCTPSALLRHGHQG